MTDKLISGKLFFNAAGKRQRAKGSFTYNLGVDKGEPIKGVDGHFGKKVVTVTPFIEGKVSDSSELDVKALISATGTFTLELANGKTVMLSEGYNGADADITTEESEIPLKIYGARAEELL